MQDKLQLLQQLLEEKQKALLEAEGSLSRVGIGTNRQIQSSFGGGEVEASLLRVTIQGLKEEIVTYTKMIKQLISDTPKDLLIVGTLQQVKDFLDTQVEIPEGQYALSFIKKAVS